MSDVLDPDSFMARAARFFQTGNNAKEDSDSDSETEASSKIAQENIVVKEKKGVDQVSERVFLFFVFLFLFCFVLITNTFSSIKKL